MCTELRHRRRYWLCQPRLRDDADAEIPGHPFTLRGNYPNPFTDEMVFAFSTPASANIRLDMFNMLGCRVATVTDQAYPRGGHQGGEGMRSG